jgi:pimeloyl-ACP methyl ester carboxylesterase
MRISALALGVICSCSSSASQHGDSVDAGPGTETDAETVGAWTSAPPCIAAADAIYTTPSPLPAGARGSIVECALGAELSVTEAQAKLGSDVPVATTGVRVVKLSFRTVRSDGRDTVSTASAYLPLVPRAVPAPVILVGRSTSGIADKCAPSRSELPQDNLALPLAARGFVTITPDFAGLGNEGTHAYLDNHEAAAELFDAALAARALVPGHVVGAAVAAIGYSQGGGTVLSAQALEHEITGARGLRAVVAIATEWPISTKSFNYEAVLRDPDRITALAGLSAPVVTVLRHYGFAANKMAGGQGGETFPVSEASSLISAIESRCTVDLGGVLNAQQTRLRQLVDGTFRDQVLACIDDDVAGCTGSGAAFHSWLTSDFVTADPAGAPVMIVHGLGDQVMPAASEAACVVAKLHADGVQPTLCTDATATHASVLGRRIGDAVRWMEAAIAGTARPSCASQTLPACSR